MIITKIDEFKIFLENSNNGFNKNLYIDLISTLKRMFKEKDNYVSKDINTYMLTPHLDDNLIKEIIQDFTLVINKEMKLPLFKEKYKEYLFIPKAKYVIYGLPIGVISQYTGKTKYGWSIIGNGDANIYFGGWTFIYGLGLEIGDTYIIVHNDNYNKILSSGTIKDMCKNTEDEFRNLLKRNDYAPYPPKAYTKQSGKVNTNTGYSIKGYDNINPIV